MAAITLGTLGMIGGGQLGRMSAIAAKQLGLRVVTLDPTPASPGGQVSDEQLVARYDDRAALDRLAQRCDAIGYEFENVPADTIAYLERSGCSVAPRAGVLAVTQSRIAEKTFLRGAGLQVAAFGRIESEHDIAHAVATIGVPAMLKTDRGGYDGKGQVRVGDAAQGYAALRDLTARPLIWEREVAFERELSVVCARSRDGSVATYPVGANGHVDGILDTTVAPAPVTAAIADRAREIAVRVATELELVGVIGVELFLTDSGALLVNELAPRPHNSGHYTIESCACSQFEQHVRAVCGMPLGSTAMRAAAAMANVLGPGEGRRLGGIEAVLALPEVHFHWYGKSATRAGRKMGHITALAPEAAQALGNVVHARAQLRWEVER